MHAWSLQNILAIISLKNPQNTVFPPYLQEGTIQDPQWMPENSYSTETYIYYACSSTYIPMTTCSLWIRHNKKISELPASLLLQFGAIIK